MKKTGKRTSRTQAIKSATIPWRFKTRAVNGKRSLSRINELSIKSNYSKGFYWGVVLALLV